MSEQEYQQWLAQQISANLPSLARLLEIKGKRLEDITGLRCNLETVPREHNYLAALHGDQEEERYIRSQLQEYLHTGYINVQVTFADESVLRERVYEPTLKTKRRRNEETQVG